MDAESISSSFAYFAERGIFGVNQSFNEPRSAMRSAFRRPYTASCFIVVVTSSAVCAVLPASVATQANEVAPSTQPAATPAKANADLLADYLTGHFSSAAQAKTDMQYFEIHLHAARIWKDRQDGPWIYVEQARGDSLNEPYRQRVYHVVQLEDGTFASHVFELPDPEKAIGAWKDDKALAGVTPQMLTTRTGCTVYMKYEDGKFVGGTKEKECQSSLRGASYATSEVTATPEGLRTWDRGYDADGKQVWGAKAGPYVFERVK
jgi:CpeT protein